MKTIQITKEAPMVYGGVDGRLIPCRYVRSHNIFGAVVRITKTGQGYKQGEQIHVDARYLIPREVLGYKNGKRVVRGGFGWEFPIY